MTIERGPLRRYAVTWTSGHVEVIEAHQCITPQSPGLFTPDEPTRSRWLFHGEINGRWGLILATSGDDIRMVRDVTADERLGDRS